MYANQPLSTIRYRDLLLTGLIVIGGLIYLIVWLNTGDLLWFLPRVADQAAQIVVYDAGKAQVITPRAPGYQEINAAINKVLSDRTGYVPQFGLSDETRERYRTQDWVIEVFYDKPVQLHSPYHLGEPNCLLIPLEGRHAEQRVVFMGKDGEYWPGVLGVRNLTPIKVALAKYGY